MRWFLLLLAAFITLGHGAAARAAVVLDQSHFVYSSRPMAIGGDSEQMVAQTFRAGRSGRLHHIVLLLGCDAASPGLLTVELQRTDASGQPDGHVLAAVSRESAFYAGSFDTLHDIPFDAPLIEEGTLYAIVIRAERQSRCSMPGIAAIMVGYLRGLPWFDARPNPPGWVAMADHLGYDLFFRVYLEVSEPAAPRWCEFEDANGMSNDWLPNHVPICACLSDASLRTNRCWFAFPEFVAWRELHWNGNRGFANWGVTPIDPGFAGMRISERGIDADLKVDPVKVPGQLPPGLPAQFDVMFTGTARRSSVQFEIRRVDGTDPIKVRFEAQIDIPLDKP